MGTDVNLVRAKVQEYMGEFGQIDLLPNGTLSFAHESTRVFVDLMVSEEPTSVALLVDAPVALDVPVSPQLWEAIGRRNGSLVYGSFTILTNEDRADVVFRYSLLADYLDREELVNAVGMVVAIANAVDEEFVAEFGGRRFIDGQG